MAGALSNRIEAIEKQGGISGRDVAQLLNTSPETVSRWKKGKVSPHTDRLQLLLSLEWLVSEMSELYPPEEAKLWLFSHHKLLGGDRPADRIQSGKIGDVLAIIDQLKTGAYI